MTNPIQNYYPEFGFDELTHDDGTLQFYSFVKGAYLRFDEPRVLDFGAGRGGWHETDRSKTRRNLRDLRVGAGHVVAVDVDEAVLQNRCSHEQIRIMPNDPLPFLNEQFDVIVADFVFEHVADPNAVCRELDRVLKPGGVLCIRTPNRYGYVALAARMIPNCLKSAVLRRSQPNRRDEDVFPGCYLLNRPSDIQPHFPGYAMWFFYGRTPPAYAFGSRAVFGTLAAVEAITPQNYLNMLCVFLEKPADAELTVRAEF